MPGLGTIINTVAIIVAGIIGLTLGKFFNEKLQKAIIIAMGISISLISVQGFISESLVISEGNIGTKGTYVLLFSMILGTIIGEIIDIDAKTEKFGIWLKQKTGNAKDVKFVDGFLNATFTVCIGAMAIMGSIQDGILHDYTTLLTKSILDFVIIIILSASMGKGCVFSAIPVALFQGSITLLSRLISPILNDLAISNLSLVGSVLILCVGLNLLFDGKFRIKVSNMLPAVIFAVLSAYIPFLN